MIIDIHVHPFCNEITVTPNYEEAFERMFRQQRNPQKMEALKSGLALLFEHNTVDNIIADMDRNHIDKACIVAMNLTTRYGVELVTNEDVGRLAKAHPERFIPFASVDPNMGQAAVDQLKYSVEKLGCKGLKLVPPVQHFDFSDPKHDPLWQLAQDLDIIVWTHCSHQLSHPDSDARLGSPMLIEPVAHKFRDLKIVLGHCGFPWVWEVWSLITRHMNVYMDISAYTELYNHMPWDAYTKYNVEHKVLFATDYPLVSFDETLAALNNAEISEEFRNKILHENVGALLT